MAKIKLGNTLVMDILLLLQMSSSIPVELLWYKEKTEDGDSHLLSHVTLSRPAGDTRFFGDEWV